jgi:archaellum component FlaF (FlaF/FlaG flagellin family)
MSYIASVMVVVLAVISLGGAALYWGLTQIGENTRSWDQALEERLNYAGERLAVEKVSFTYVGTKTQVKVYLRNVGSVQVTITRVLVDHRLTYNSQTSNGAQNLTLGPWQTGWVQVEVPYRLTSGEGHTILVGTSRGNAFEARWKTD